MGPVLEGASEDAVAGQTVAGLSSGAATLPVSAAHHRPGPRSSEPRPEIWFRRKVRLIPSLRELWLFRELVVTLAERDLRVRYKQALLGLAWAIITPVAMMIA